ncbi:hypothetical protein PA598K_04171 [Paenibacillus sp. 598K]|uniref:S-layer homology domain-containing protein n=1 Tax=Paenibacillus sp. 598K TaxID=1117987 RepID=UPI000FF9CA1C|nr:S-layer homology domain-containing protein [Paenibacillus sp. 598K]GBF75743.1 hypothetical protein PA598K_04171 [Paenibacillus sp. 598K]
MMKKKWISGSLALLLAAAVGTGWGLGGVAYAAPDGPVVTPPAPIVVLENSINKTAADMVAWATGYRDYIPNESLTNVNEHLRTPERAVGPYNGQYVVLGDFGEITMEFEDGGIGNGPGEDFAVFENGIANTSVPGWGFLELAYVEVSTDGETWLRFDSESKTKGAVGAYSFMDQSEVNGLAGKSLGDYGTGFDLEALKHKPEVLSGLVDLERINYVKILDIVGDGNQVDSKNNSIYDPYPSYGSAGFDLTGIGVINKSFYLTQVEIVSPDLAHEGLPLVKEVEAKVGSTAFNALLQAVGEEEVEYSVHPEFGAYIESIKGLAGTAKDWWSFLINDAFAEVGASSYLVQDGDDLKWSYTYTPPTPEPEPQPQPSTPPSYSWYPPPAAPVKEEVKETPEEPVTEEPVTEEPVTEQPVEEPRPAVPAFVDQASASTWAQHAVLRVAELGIFTGKPSGEGVVFDPKGTATRAEFTKILVTLAQSDSDTATEVTSEFNDVSATAWYAGYVSVAKNQGWITGFADGAFQPSAAITRQDAAVLIARAFGLKASDAAPSFRDVQAAYAVAAVRALAEAGIMEGYNGSFRPQDVITREELAVVALRVYEAFVGSN